jgi:hypothetical protein
MTDEGVGPRGGVEERLRGIRGAVAPKRHNARTIAALTSNPGCGRRAVVDAAGIDKERLAGRVGFPAPFGQSEFAIVRGNVFERQVKADAAAALVALLREPPVGLELAGADHVDLGSAATGDGVVGRLALSRARLLAVGGAGRALVVDHPLLTLEVAGQEVVLEPDLVAVEPGGRCHVVEIKSFPVIDGQADGEKVAAAAIQAAVYVLALRRLVGEAAVSHRVVLVCPRDFANAPAVTTIDVRRQLLVLGHQLGRMARIETLLDALPAGLSLDLVADADGRPTRAPGDLAAALAALAARYAPACLATCELAFFCRDEAGGQTAALGISVREELGGLTTVDEALGYAHGELDPDEEHADAAAMLRTAARVYAEALGAGDPGAVGFGAAAAR